MDPAIARALRRHGIDVTTTPEAGLLGRSDEAQWAYLLASRRALVTHDIDFLRLADRDQNHPGILFCRRTTYTIGGTIRHLILMVEVLSVEELWGRVEFL